MICHLLLALPALLPGVVEPRPTAPGQDDVRVPLRFEGLPAGAFLESLDRGQELLKVSLRPEKGTRVERTVTLGEAIEGVALSLPGKGKLRVSGGLLGIYLHMEGLEAEFGKDAASELRIELPTAGAEQVGFEGLPGGLLEGARLVSNVNVRVTAGKPDPMVFRGEIETTIDDAGRAFTVGRLDGSLACRLRPGPGWAGTVPMERVAREVTVDGRTQEVAALVPSRRVVYLTAPKGLALEWSKGHVRTPMNGWSKKADPAHRLALTLADDDVVTLFVDRKRLGSKTFRELGALGDGLIDVRELEFERRDNNLQITIQPGARPLRDPELWLTPDGPPVLDFGDSVFRQGAVVPQGESARNADTLGFWAEPRTSGLAASTWVPPGRYLVSLSSTHAADIVRLAPVVVEEGRQTSLHLDVSAAKPYLLVGRHARGTKMWSSGACGLLIGGGWARLDRYQLAGWDRRNRAPNPDLMRDEPDECFADIWTFDGPPTEALLFNAPGAQMRRVKIRAPRDEAEAPGADLVVEMPRLRWVNFELAPAHGGELFGWSEASPRRWEPSRGPRLSLGGLRFRSVQTFGDERIRIWARDPVVRGVLLESVRGNRTAVRDWFLVTPQQSRLLAGGEGRWVSFTSGFDAPIELHLSPGVVDGHVFEREFAGTIKPGETQRLWVPSSAVRVECVSVPPFEFTLREQMNGKPDRLRPALHVQKFSEGDALVLSPASGGAKER